ncbi:MAG: TolC family protein [Candidatus Omnitrophica bacterium]|nr:TolC family protein [Candidatus Omnitrophota bacterium]
MAPLRLPLLLLCFTIALATPAAAQEILVPIPPQQEQPDSAAAGRLLTLADCFALALKRSEEIAISGERLEETRGRFLQALGSALPDVSFVSTDKRQDGTGATAFTLKHIPERRFTFTQPLFTGFKEFAAVAGARAERQGRLHEKARAEQLLFVDVADAFYLLTEQRRDLFALETIRATLLARIEELEDRRRLGRSRASEVASVEAQLRRVEAEMEQARSAETTARQLLEFLTGLPRLEGVADQEIPLGELAPEGAYVGKAAARPDVRAAEEAWRLAQHETAVARADYWPEVDLEGNYYTERVGNAKDVEWDVLLTVDVPIFQGGSAKGAVRSAASRARQAQLRFEQTRRQAELDIRDRYALLQAAVARARALDQAWQAAEENYRLQLEDYRLSLVNTLDVLETLQDLEDARREVIRADYELKRLYWQLLVATGELPHDAL